LQAITLFDISRNMETIRVAAGFAALGQESRIELMRLLATRHSDGLAAGQLARKLGLAPSTLSFHIAALEGAGLVTSRREGRRIIYAIRPAGLRALFGFLTETCCHGHPDLCSELTRLLPDQKSAVSIMMPAFNVLFLCTHNSARSIIAEAILEEIGARRFNAYSAGSTPYAEPLPAVIDRLQAIGHDVSRLRSKSWIEFSGPEAPRMDFVIAMCDTLENQQCPDFGGHVVTASWPFPDPAKFAGTPTEQATMINALYGMIRRRLEIFVNLPFDSLDRMALRARLDELADHSRIDA
jgi:ArsR family transcriptional regulator, arsenate/arsenite/antimonite-responsive transcriptional repressor / arsenate reductase (thioredoxin)